MVLDVDKYIKSRRVRFLDNEDSKIIKDNEQGQILYINPKNFKKINHILSPDTCIKKVLDLFGNPQDKLKYIHVAGTNGKTSVCQMLQTILKNNGLKVGFFSTPYFFTFNHAIQINNKPISNTNLAKYILKIDKVANKNLLFVNWFELLIISAFFYFLEKKVDVVVLETGVGGRDDATNVIKDNLCSIITHIDYDHTDKLGNTKEEIAYAKAGIIKQNRPVIVGEKHLAIEKEAKEKNSPIYYANPVEKECSLRGSNQKFNLGLAIKACEILGYDVKDEWLLKVKNPLRFEYLKKYNTLLDIGHITSSIIALRKNLDEYYPNQDINFIFACDKSRDYERWLNILVKENDTVFVYEYINSNYIRYEDIEKVFKGNLKHFEEYKRDDKLTVICGSSRIMMQKRVLNDLGIEYNS